MKKKIFIIVVGLFFLTLMICMDFSDAQEQYVIGYQTDITGPGSSNMAPQAEGFKLYMQTLNDRGGIKGRRVNVIYEDDKSSPPRAGAIATKFILEDKVLLIAGLSFSVSQPPVFELAKKHNVPVVVPYSCPVAAYAPVEEDCRQVFATGPIMSPKFHYHGYAEALIVSKLFPKGSTIGSMSYGTPGGRILSSWGAKWCEKRGYKVVYHEDIPPGTVDVSSWVDKIVKANPDVLMPVLGGEISVPLMTNLEKMGYNKPVLNANYLNTDDFLKIGEGLIKPKENLYIYSELAMPIAATPPKEYEEIQKAMKKYGHTYSLSARHASGWLTAQVIEVALAKVGWPASRSALIEALEKTDLVTKGLSGGPIRFNETDHYGMAYVKAYRWDPFKKVMIDALDWQKFEPAKIAKETQ